MQIKDTLIPIGLSLIAGFSTLIGSCIFLFLKECKKSHLSFLMGLSAGVMIYLSFMELLPHSVSTLGLMKTNLVFFAGFLLMGILDFLIPHHYMQEKNKEKTEDMNLAKTGIFVAIGLMIHNFPEGITVAMSSLANLKMGLLMTAAIALHNIPEGIAVAVPIYYGTKSRKKAFKYSFLSGMAEPLGAILAMTILWPFLNEILLSYIFALVAGIMVFISFDELLPCCFKNGHGHIAISGIMLGMILMAVTICVI